MNSVLLLILCVTAVLTGSSLSLVFNQFVSKIFPTDRIFSTAIPGVTSQLAGQKSFDLVDFLLTVVFTVLVFGINFAFVKWVSRKNKYKDFKLGLILLLVFSTFIFLSTHFVNYSKSQILISWVLFEGIFFGVSLINRRKIHNILENIKEQNGNRILIIVGNGLFLGFFILQLLVKFSSFAILPLLVFGVMPFLFLGIYGLANKKINRALSTFPGLVFILSPFFLYTSNFLLILLAFALLFWIATYFLKADLYTKSKVGELAYYVGLIFIFVFNPLFYVGNFDSVEEGFWLGWVQRLLEGQVLYRDVAVYHPPFLVWGMYLFSLISGVSIYSERLFLHLLQILAVVIFFFVLKNIYKKSWVILLVLILILSFTSTLVRNNIEIRLALGLLSLLPFLKFLRKRNFVWLIVAGFLAALSFLTSIEVGICSILTLLAAVNFFFEGKFLTKKQLKNNVALFLGLLLLLFPVAVFLSFQGALKPFFEQTSFYALAFSQGYFNVPIERINSLSFFHWHIFNEYISSNAMFWEVSRLILLSSVLYFLVKRFSPRRLIYQEQFILVLSIFGLFLFRVVLGRSDWYHFLFVLIVSFIILGYFLEQLSNKNKMVAGILAFGLLFYFGRATVNSVFLEDELFKFQTYGKVIGDYKHYNFSRAANIPVGMEVDVDSMNNLVRFIDTNTIGCDTIFTFPWSPELYFYANRANATSIDAPYAFFSLEYQQKMISELKMNNPKLVIISNNKNFGGLSEGSLPEVKKYLEENYLTVTGFGEYDVRAPISKIIAEPIPQSTSSAKLGEKI